MRVSSSKPSSVAAAVAVAVSVASCGYYCSLSPPLSYFVFVRFVRFSVRSWLAGTPMKTCGRTKKRTKRPEKEGEEGRAEEG